MEKTPAVKEQHGAALIEAAFIVPLLFLLLGGLVTFGFYFINSFSVLRWSYLVSAKAAEFPSFMEDDARTQNIYKYALDIEVATIGMSSGKSFLNFDQDNFLAYSRETGSQSGVDTRPAGKLASASIEAQSVGSRFGTNQDTSKKFQFPELRKGNLTPIDPGFQSSGASAIDCCGTTRSVFSCISGFIYQCNDVSQVGYYDAS